MQETMSEAETRDALPNPPRHRWEPPWMRARAQGIRPDALLREFEMEGPPVPVDLLAIRMGVQLHKVPKPGWDGALKVEADEAHIWLDSSVSGVRQRFTLAHEIGHLVLHDDQVMFRDRITMIGTNPKEREANQYAAELLMPAVLLRGFLAGRTVDQLAKIFEVSPQAMGIRLQTLRAGKLFG